jgi:LCT (Lysosomal Cystine Transporter) family transporter
MFPVVPIFLADLSLQYNDIAFALFGFVCCLVTAFQCCVYERGNQSVAMWAKIVIALITAWICLGAVLTAAKSVQPYIYIKSLGFVKVFISCIKYAPQAYLNYRRKATTGWSIGNVLLDFTGGILSILQMVVDALRIVPGTSTTVDASDFANVPKMLLGLESILFDVVFMVQHYLLYPPPKQFHQSALSQAAAPSSFSPKPWFSLGKRSDASPHSKHASIMRTPLLSEDSLSSDAPSGRDTI